MNLELILIMITFSIPILFKLKKRIKKSLYLKKAFPESWRNILIEFFPVYSKLNPHQQEKLERLISEFIFDKQFICIKPLEGNDKITVLIAAQACLLVLEIGLSHYKKLRTIYVYPSRYKQKQLIQNGHFVYEQESINLGESWSSGQIVLAWDSSLNGAKNPDDGKNVAYHEFAHQLDQVDGNSDGLPSLNDYKTYPLWIKTFRKEYERLKKDKRHKTTLDRYGLTNNAEFFAVATEAFFEKPIQVKKNHKELYSLMQQFFELDPEEWK